MLKWVLWIAGGLVALVAVVYAIGLSLPRDHVAQASRVIPMPIEQVAARIRDVGAYPEWREGVAIEGVNEGEGVVTYVEIADGDRIPYRRTEQERDRRFVAIITDETLPFGGQWTFTLEPEGEATRVTIEETGEIRDPLYRFFARYMFGYTSTMEGYLNSLEASLT